MVDLRLQPNKGKTFKHIDRFVAPRATLEERVAAGKALRDTLPDQTERDYEVLVKAARSGRIEVAPGRA